MTKNTFTFEDFFQQNERRIHYYLHKLNIRDPHQEFFQERMIAMWNAYENYEPDKGPLSTYFNFTIRIA
ncbi:sigma factor [Oceanobacillus arenosus]|uniref:sigma factor n=1 Tax=Oceanobacillus arenosus TaxID=1229153 RepID=UPI000E210CE2|nr:sigma factor [Oceanobacillus arenosus]